LRAGENGLVGGEGERLRKSAGLSIRAPCHKLELKLLPTEKSNQASYPFHFYQAKYNDVAHACPQRHQLDSHSHDSIDIMSPTLFQMPFLRPRSIKPLITIKTFVRQSSSSTLPLDQLEADLRKELKKRIWTTQHDYLSPTPSQLLNISLADFFPDSCYPRSFNKNDLNIPPESKKSLILPQGHHLVYFPPLIPDSNLLPDGTDPLHSPGPPFVRRMWAGGSLQFNFSQTRQFIANGMSVYMQEGISDVSIKGTEGAEKVFVTIKRGYNKMQHQKPIDFIQHATIARRKNLPAILETRNLVFMREKSKEAAEEDAARPGKILKRWAPFNNFVTTTD